MQPGPETVVAVREVVAVVDGPGRKIQSAEDDIETFGQDIRLKLGHIRCDTRPDQLRAAWSSSEFTSEKGIPEVAAAMSPLANAVAASCREAATWVYIATPILMRLTPAAESSATVGVSDMVPTTMLTGLGATAFTIALTAAMSGGYGA